KALALAEKLVQLLPDELEFGSTRGEAHYRAGHLQEAKSDLQTAIDLRTRKKPNDFWDQAGDALYLAMANWQLGEKDEARKWYGKALDWMKQHRGDATQLKRRNAEAARLLELEKND